MIIKTTITEAMEGFREELESRDYAASTKQTYMAKADRFEDMFKKYQAEHRHVPYVSSIGPVIVAKFLGSYHNLTRNDALKMLRTFLRWSVRMRYIGEADALAAIGDRKMIPFNRRPKHYLPAEQFGDALEIAGQRHPHDRAVFAVALYTLCRVSEITTLRLRDVALLAGDLSVYRQKTKRWTTEVIPPDLREELDLWLSWYASEVGYPSPAALIAARPDWLLLPKLTFKARSVAGLFCATGNPPTAQSPASRNYRSVYPR